MASSPLNSQGDQILFPQIIRISPTYRNRRRQRRRIAKAVIIEVTAEYGPPRRRRTARLLTVVLAHLLKMQEKFELEISLQMTNRQLMQLMY
ncbi:hypothetical protein RR46_07458 [Papilio xuthus]|uniref:Uncharacterized protein n=1 Tax=Papilio xuthus TaxID=66420 RepID=A0A194PWF7_PAPXU|nr:hypothetical protein RR46_07458 [Papilio xuthus]